MSELAERLSWLKGRLGPSPTASAHRLNFDTPAHRSAQVRRPSDA